MATAKYWAIIIPSNSDSVKEVRGNAKSIGDALANIQGTYGDVLVKEFGYIGAEQTLSEIALEDSAPATPTNLALTVLSDTEISFTHDTMDRATWYEYICVAGDATADAETFVRYTASDLPVTISELTAETEYDVYVRACNNYGGSAWSAEATDTTEAAG